MTGMDESRVPPQIRIVGGNVLLGETRTISTGEFVIGRSEECDLCLPANCVSRRHCMILFDGETLKIRDLGSLNGTYVHGRRIEAEEVLKNCEVVSIGTTHMVVDAGYEKELLRTVLSNDHFIAPVAFHVVDSEPQRL